MCRRQALLLKKEVKLQRQQAAELEADKDAAGVAAVVKLARERALKFARSEEGRLYLKNLAKKATGNVVAAKQRERREAKADAEHDHHSKALTDAYEKRKAVLDRTRGAKEAKLKKQLKVRLVGQLLLHGADCSSHFSNRSFFILFVVLLLFFSFDLF